MPPLNPEALADIVALAIKTATAPLVARIGGLESRGAQMPRDGRDGQSIIGQPGEKGLTGERGERGEPGPAGSNGIAGKDGAPGREADESVLRTLSADVAALREEIASLKVTPDAELLATEVAKAVALIPLAPAGKDGAPGAPGASVDRSEVEAMVAKAVDSSLATRPPEITTEELAESFTALLKQELGVLPVSPVQPIQKRILRDRSGKIERVIEEPATA